MIREPHRLTRWKLKQSPLAGHLFTCARPGRSKGSKVNIPDDLVNTWVKGLPDSEEVTIVSLLGRKPTGKSEFSFYSFRGGFESERPRCPTFQEWLDGRYGSGRYRVLEYPTIDLQQVPSETLSQVSATVLSLIRQGRTVVLMDSGGFSRVERVCTFMGFRREE